MPLDSRGGQRGQENSLKLPKDTNKASLKGTINLVSKFPWSLASDKKALLLNIIR